MEKVVKSEKGDAVIGHRVKVLRGQNSMTQKKLAELALVSPSCITRLESGQCMVSVFTMLKIAEALQVSIADILESKEFDGFDISELSGIIQRLKQCSPDQRRMIVYSFELFLNILLKSS